MFLFSIWVRSANEWQRVCISKVRDLKAINFGLKITFTNTKLPLNLVISPYYVYTLLAKVFLLW